MIHKKTNNDPQKDKQWSTKRQTMIHKSLSFCGPLFVFLWIIVCRFVDHCLSFCGPFYLSFCGPLFVFLWIIVCVFVDHCLFFCGSLFVFLQWSTKRQTMIHKKTNNGPQKDKQWSTKRQTMIHKKTNNDPQKDKQ
jgi:hypothetical protein